MTLILKSDKTAVNTIGNAYGIKGATDFVAVLDFNRDVYKYKDNGSFVDTDLASAISLARTSAAEYKDLNNSTQVAAANEPRLHYMQDKGVRGLLIEPARTNLFVNPSAPVTQTVSVPTTGSVKGLILSIEGTGSATMSGAIGATNIAAATQGNPQATIPSYAASTASVTVTLTGNVTRVQLEQAASTASGGCASTFVPVGLTERKADVVKLGSALNTLLPSVKTVVAQYVYFDRVVSGLASTVNVFALEDSARASGGIYVSRGRTASDTLTLKTYTVAPNTTTIEKTLATPITKNTVATMAVSFDSGGTNLHHGINGYIVEVAGTNTPVTANSMTIGSKNQHSSATAEAGGILTRLVMFDRKLSVAELQEITRSWL